MCIGKYRRLIARSDLLTQSRTAATVEVYVMAAHVATAEPDSDGMCSVKRKTFSAFADDMVRHAELFQ